MDDLLAKASHELQMLNDNLITGFSLVFELIKINPEVANLNLAKMRRREKI